MKEIYEGDAPPRGFAIKGTGKGAIDVHKAKRPAILLTVLADPCGKVWPEQTKYKNMNRVRKALRETCGAWVSARLVAEIKEKGCFELGNGVIVNDLGDDGYRIDWPKSTALVLAGESDFKAGMKCEIPTVAMLHSLLPLWGIEMTREKLYGIFQDHRAYEADGLIRAEYVPVYKCGRFETFGKPNHLQSQIKEFTKFKQLISK